MSKNERTPREMDTRDAETRDAELRQMLKAGYNDKLYVDPKKIPHGVEYRWLRESVYNEPDHGNIGLRRQRGWTPVPAERHPELCFTDHYGKNQHVQGHIFVQGLVLYERNKEYGEIEMKAHDERHNQLLNSLPGLNNMLGDPSMPVRHQNRVSTTQGMPSFLHD